MLTLLFLAIYRVGWQIRLPFVDEHKMTAFFSQSGQSGLGDLFQQVAVFSASQLSQATIFGLGIMPYISASIIFQLLGSVYPPLEKLQKEGESGRKKINEYTRYATVFLCIGQSWVYVTGFLVPNHLIYEQFLTPSGSLPFIWQFTAVITMTAGTVFLMWLGEQIDEYGIGNGISLLIMAGILGPHARGRLQRFDQAACSAERLRNWAARSRAGRRGNAADAGRPVCRRGRRRGVDHPGTTPHSHPKRQARPRPAGLRRHAAVPAAAGQPGRRDAHHLRQQLVAVPLRCCSSTWPRPTRRCGRPSHDAFHRGDSWTYNILYILLIYFFCYFWTAITFNPKDMSDNLKNYGTFIPGYRPGRRTADYLEKVMVRITYVGAGFSGRRGHRSHAGLRLDRRQRTLAWPVSTAAPAC